MMVVHPSLEFHFAHGVVRSFNLSMKGGSSSFLEWGMGLDFSLSSYVIRIRNSFIKPFWSYTLRDYALV